MLINKKVGSAYLIAIGAIVVLAILAGTALRTTTERSYSTRYMSNEKKAEAVLESATDLVIAYAKFHMNNEDASDGSHAKNFYNIFRFPAPMINPSMSNETGANHRLDVANLPQITNLAHNFEALSPLSSMIDDLGADNVEMSINCRIAQAEVFTSDLDGYEVPGITVRPAEATGRSARFLDSINENALSDDSLNSASWAPSDWQVDFNLPSLTKSDSHTFPYLIFDVIVDLEILAPAVFKIMVNAKAGGLPRSEIILKVILQGILILPGIDFDEEDFQIDAENGEISIEVLNSNFNLNEILNEVAIDLDGKDFTVQNVRDYMMPGSNLSVATLLYQASQLRSAIYSEYSGLPRPLGISLAPDNFESRDLTIVEKGGVFEIEANIAYKPQGDSGPVIKRQLVAHMPFKVSDVQPIAPEYSFFVANSSVMAESVPTINTLGGVVNLSSTSGAFIVHNVPEGNYSALTGLNLPGSDIYRQPGMLRINSNEMMSLNLPLGNLDEPYTCSFNPVVSPWQELLPRYSPSARYSRSERYKPLPVFQWGGETITPEHEFDLPVLFDSELTFPPIQPTGLRNLETFFKSAGLLLEGGTLLFGKSHLEYPLGIRMEAPLNMISSRIKIEVEPQARMFKDNTEIYVKYDHREHPYGILDYPAYDRLDQWSPDDTKNWPANAYSMMQYAKKATYFYQSGAEFLADTDRKAPDGSWDINGVTYISGELDLTLSDPEFKVKGKGIIVTKGNIKINTNIRRADEDTVFSLVARGGGLIIGGSCTEIEAACFSNRTPQTVSSDIVNIRGNLVVNEFDRSEITNLRVYYDGHACRTSPLSIMRDVGKFAPSRYYVSMAENWSRFGYEKNM